jgi:hypothetical protein
MRTFQNYVTMDAMAEQWTACNKAHAYVMNQLFDQYASGEISFEILRMTAQMMQGPISDQDLELAEKEVAEVIETDEFKNLERQP